MHLALSVLVSCHISNIEWSAREESLCYKLNAVWPSTKSEVAYSLFFRKYGTFSASALRVRGKFDIWPHSIKVNTLKLAMR